MGVSWGMQRAGNIGAALVVVFATACGRLGYDWPATSARRDAATDAVRFSPGVDPLTGNGPADASGADAIGSGGPGDAADIAGCARHPGALFCEDFESGLPTGNPAYYTFTSSGTLEVTGLQVRSGSAALRATANLNDTSGARARMHYKLPAALSSGLVYFRSYVYLSSPLAVPDAIVLLQLQAPTDKISMDLRPDSRVSAHCSVKSGLYAISDPGTVALDRWICTEMAMDIGPAGDVELLWDQDSMARTSTGDTGGAYDEIMFGVVWSGSTTASPVELFMDDVVLSTTPVGCD